VRGVQEHWLPYTDEEKGTTACRESEQKEKRWNLRLIVFLPGRAPRVFYSIYVGSQHIISPIQGEDLRALYHLAQRKFEKESH
jgi:hypothetical protein